MDAPDEEVQQLVQDRLWIREKCEAAECEEVSKECIDLLRKMLRSDRHLRITAAEALKHPFIKNSYKKRNSPRHVIEEADAVLKAMASNFEEFGTEPTIVKAALL